MSLKATFDVSYNARPRVRSRLVLRFDELSVACRWQRAVQEATKDGAGWLKARRSLQLFQGFRS